MVIQNSKSLAYEGKTNDYEKHFVRFVIIHCDG